MLSDTPPANISDIKMDIYRHLKLKNPCSDIFQVQPEENSHLDYSYENSYHKGGSDRQIYTANYHQMEPQTEALDLSVSSRSSSPALSPNYALYSLPSPSLSDISIPEISIKSFNCKEDRNFEGKQCPDCGKLVEFVDSVFT